MLPACDYHWHEDAIKELRDHNEKLRKALEGLIVVLKESGVAFPTAWKIYDAEALLTQDPPMKLDYPELKELLRKQYADLKAQVANPPADMPANFLQYFKNQLPLRAAQFKALFEEDP